ncbi:helix-turn-helix domain-containing protein [Candidatus Enterococcus mansonii]|uniref:HTH cro/C1-type domain-containing protein n=1 Tax=Candidatus Enterococcus mansonii TaxID=1834181 RepID=A0A242CEW0_9ENTE|nr:helix-turn-helix domain-containing protein [Enterococcus sp. 4G2_DIV0659]OTO08794.1 hypothetical protein A5880_001794 [Enterococcus sp. 4G2_DIV0659]
MNIGKALKERRQKLNLTQQELAEKMHVSRQTISNWEVGRSYPDIESLIQLSDLFSISLDKLIKGDREMVTSLKKRSILEMLFVVILSLLMVSSVICLIIDVSINMRLSWSLVVVSSCIFGASLMSVMRYAQKEKLIKFGLTLSVLVMPLLFTIQKSVSVTNWFSYFGISISLISLGIFWALLLLWRFTTIKLWGLMTIAAVLSIGGNYLILVLTGEVTSMADVSTRFITSGLAGSIWAFVSILFGLLNLDKGAVDEWLFEHVRKK